VSDRAYSKTEIMIAASARGLEGATNCFVGVGLPNIVCNLAQRTVARDLLLVYESGVFGARPERLPLSIGDPTLATGATAITSMFELFAFYLQAGLIDVAFLGGAQIDRFGNLNTTVIGPYDTPKVRLPGSGGACEIAIHARHILVIMRQAKRSFVDRLDFRTSPGHSGDPAHDAARGWHGTGPTSVVTDLGTYGFDDATGEMTLMTLHPGMNSFATNLPVDFRLAPNGYEAWSDVSLNILDGTSPIPAQLGGATATTGLLFDNGYPLTQTTPDLTAPPHSVMISGFPPATLLMSGDVTITTGQPPTPTPMPTPGGAAPKLTFPAGGRLSAGTATLLLRCARSATCAGTLSIRSRARAAPRGKRALTYGTAAFAIPAGHHIGVQRAAAADR